VSPAGHGPSEPEPLRRLPLFPLPVVLLPGASMPLHIFEPRYRDMVRDCLAGDRRFGLVYHDWDRSGPFLSDEGRVGCVAEIREHESLPDGRSNLVVAGMERFRIVDGIESDTAYFEALVGPYRDLPEPGSSATPPDLRAARLRSIALFLRVVESLEQSPPHLPVLGDEGETAFVLAQAIAADPAWHQQLLETQDERDRLSELDRVFLGVLGG